ncbi:MAG TPA: N-methyl-L-tryptophan oxidase [Streptosporangiales bacterium]
MSDAPSVAVVGLGSIGAMTAWRLARRGARVTGFERYSPGHDHSAHGGETRIFRTAYLESPDYVPLLRRAQELWRDLEKESGARLLHLGGVLTIGSAATEEIANVLASAETYGLDLEEVPAAEARRRYPQYRVGDDESVLLDREAGYLRPELAVLHAGLTAEANGALVHRYTTVTAIEPDADGVVVRTSAGTAERFDHVAVATGPWAARLLGELGYPGTIEVRRPVQAWFPGRDPARFAPDRCPVFIRVSGTRCYGLPAMDGSGLKLGLHAVDNRVVPDPDALDTRIGTDELAAFRTAAAEVLPGVYPEPTRVSAYMEGYTPDGHGVVGRLPGAERVTLLVGFSGHGFKLAPAFGELGADAVLGERTAPLIPQLDPARFVR